jgi:hypothetical protein
MFGRARIPCLVRNISSTGALLAFSAAIALPETFRLDIDDDHFKALREVRRYSGCQYGIRFKSNVQGAPARYG